MSLSLYRKYRPTKFCELVGQESIKKTLLGALRQARITHAYLFCGPKGTGKTTTARILAKAVNCQNLQDGEPDNNCQICQDFNSGRSLDLIEIDAASHRGIDQVKDLISKIQFSPTQAKYKVFVIDEVHMLSRDAFGALLKTLEEPPAHAIFILATTDPHKIPPTIISRCQRFDFKRVSEEDLIRRLKIISKKEEIKYENGVLELISENAEGSFRDAEGFLDQIISYVGKNIAVNDLETILGITDQKAVIILIDLITKKDRKGALEYINKIIDDGYQLDQFNKNLIEYLRKLLIYKVNQDIFAKSIWLKHLQVHGNEISISYILKMLKAFIDTQNQIKQSTIMQLPLEMAVISLISNIDATDNVTPVVDKKKISKEVKEKSGQKSDLKKLDNLLEFWPKILEKTKLKNHSILLILRNTIPVEIRDNTIILGVRFKFHADQIMAERKKIILLDVLEEVLGKRYEINYRMVGSMSPNLVKHIEERMRKLERKSEEDLYNMAHKVFG